MGWLIPADRTHPVRLDVPVWRHLTFTEAHAIELGAALAVFVAWVSVAADASAAVPLAVFVVRKVFSNRRSKGEGTSCDHSVGLHDARAEPHYFAVAAVLIGLLAWAVTLAM